MRTRRWLGRLGTAGILALVPAGVASPALAQEVEAEEAEIGHAEEECIEILEGGGSIDDCQEAPSPILPEVNEIIWGSLAFAVLFLGMWKFGLPAVRNMMHAREERIRTDLERAEAARLEAEGVLDQYRAQLAEARTEAGRIIDEARQSADEVRRELIARAEADAAEVRERARQDVTLATERAMAELRSRVGHLSIDLAEKIVERNLDRDTQMALIEQYIEEVGSR